MLRPSFTAGLLFAATLPAFAQTAQTLPPLPTPPQASGSVRPIAPAPLAAAASVAPGAAGVVRETTTTQTQVVAAASPAATVPPPVIPRPAGASATGPVPPPAPGAGEMVTLQYPNSDVADVLRLYETLTGKKLVMDNFVQGKVNIFLAKPVPRDEAIKIIEINLLMNGFSLIPSEGDIVKVVGTGQNPRTTGVPIVSDPADIPPGDHVISYLFKLRYADPTELQQVLGQYLSPPKSYTSFLALPKAGAILVTENSSVIRVLARVVDQVDIPPAEVVSEFIKLQRADAQKVVDMLREVFEKGQSQQPGMPGQVRPVRPVANPNVPAPVPGQPGQMIEGDASSLTVLSEEAVVVGKIRIAADVRTNRIHVITRPVNMPFIHKLIAEFDANVEFAKPVTRPLRYISAAEVLPVLVQSLTEPGANQQGGGGAAGGADVAGNPNQQRQVNAARNTNTATTGGVSSEASGSSLNVSEELSTQAVDTTPKAVTIGNAKIIADQRSNSIIVLGNREVVVKVQKILDEMDVSSPQVALSTVVGELTLSHNEEFGIDWLQQFRHIGRNVALDPNGSPVRDANGHLVRLGSGGIGGTAANGGPAILDPASLINFTQLAAAAATGGANVYLSTGFGLSALVHALESTGNFKVVSRPTVFTTNNKKAIIANGQEIPVPVNTISNPVGGNLLGGGIAQQSNIQFKKVALQLEVVPLINSEKEVSLDILQKLDSLGETRRIDNNEIPTIATRYIRTTVTAPNCSTIVLGGLITEDTRRLTSGIPVLSRIPVVGGLFRSTSKPKQRTELIILMRPEVSLTKTDLVRLRQKNSDKTHFGAELEQDDCPDCPPRGGDKQVVPVDAKDLSSPDLPPSSYIEIDPQKTGAAKPADDADAAVREAASKVTPARKKSVSSKAKKPAPKATSSAAKPQTHDGSG